MSVAISNSSKDIDSLSQDRFAWELVHKWPVAAGFDPIHEGLDYFELTQWFLWDKVSRALRFAHQYSDVGLEQRLHIKWTEDFHKKYQLVTMPGGDFQAEADFRCRLNKARDNGQRIVYCPRFSSRIGVLEKTLCNCDNVMLFVGWPAGHGISPVPVPVYMKNVDYKWSVCLSDAIMAGLKAQGLALVLDDERVLKKQLLELVVNVRRAEAELEMLRPDALLVHTDNHPPYIIYVMVARRMGMPVVMLQHGLDCERYYLDDAYASHIAVWAEARRRAYEMNSRQALKPDLRITGNPEYDCWHPPSAMNPEGGLILWATRPHSPDKCFQFSHSPGGGAEILDAILDYIIGAPGELLCIKPHPFTARSIYAEKISRRNLENRVFFFDGEFKDILKVAKLVISEDSTAGMEGMMAGKPVLHAHLSASPPVLPFVEFNAALSGRTSSEITGNIHRALKAAPDELEHMHEGQLKFISEFAGPLDGGSAARVCRFIQEIINA